MLNVFRLRSARVLCAVAAFLPALASGLAMAEEPDCKHWITKEYFELTTLELVMGCLDGGADPNAQNNDGRTPLHLAASTQGADVTEVLLMVGADPNARDADGRTPLHLAASTRSADVTEVLLMVGADPNAQDADGLAPLHLAAMQGNTVVVEALLSAGADPNIQGEEGWTPLHEAAYSGHADVAEAMLGAGADPNARDEGGVTPLDVATTEGHLAFAAALLDAGADPNLRDRDGWTSSEVLAEHGNVDSMEVQLPTVEKFTPRRIAQRVSEYSGLAGNCKLLFNMETDFWETQATRVLRQSHEILDRKEFVPFLEEYTSSGKADLERIGFVRWCLMAESSLRADDLPTGLLGPSYDCSKAATSTEHAICSSKDLWAMDRAMASLYFNLRENSNTNRSQELLTSQRNWLKRRNTCGSSVECLMERYSSRLFDFGA